MPISYLKCLVLRLGISEIDINSLYLGQHLLSSVAEMSDLGILIDNKLRFSTHINKIVGRAHKRANLILRCFTRRDPVLLMSAFNVYVRPILEYCSIIWNPHLLKDIEAIENVQRRFTKRLPGMQNFTYHQRLVSLSLDSLELRRIRLDLIYTYKIVFGLCDLRMTDFFSKATCLTLRGHQHRLYLPTTRNSARYNFYSHRIIGAWNSLPVKKVNFNSLSSFRNSLSSDILVNLCKLSFA